LYGCCDAMFFAMTTPSAAALWRTSCSATSIIFARDLAATFAAETYFGVWPVAHIVSPIWKDEKTRDDAGEPGQLVRLLGIPVRPFATGGSGSHTVTA
jgi:hypothetical protein